MIHGFAYSAAPSYLELARMTHVLAYSAAPNYLKLVYDVCFAYSAAPNYLELVYDTWVCVQCSAKLLGISAYDACLRTVQRQITWN